MTTTQLIDHLPGIYRDSDALRELLSVFDELLFSGQPGAQAAVPGIERELLGLPALFAPLGMDDGEASARTPTQFLPWLASWLAFTPHRVLEPEQLRRVVAGIVPMYGRRGTRAYLEQLLALCFDDVAQVRVGERLQGLRLGHSQIGVDTLLAEERPFWFSVDVQMHASTAAAPRLEQRLRAVIEFAKPAHTTYDLRVRPN